MVAFDRSAISEDIWLETHHRALREARVRWISALPIAQDSAVLDVGCGEGAFSADIAADHRVQSICLVDSQENHLVQAVHSCAAYDTKVLTSQSVVCDAAQLPYADSHFDVTFCLNVLEYVEDAAAVIREIARVTKADGLVVLKDEDAFRDLILPWTVDLDTELNLAWADILRSRPSSSWKPDAGRKLLGRVFEAGFSNNVPQLIVHDIAAPLTVDQENYIRAAFSNYIDEYRARLNPASFEQLCRHLSIGPYCNDTPSWLRERGFRFQSLEYVVLFSPGGKSGVGS